MVRVAPFFDSRCRCDLLLQSGVVCHSSELCKNGWIDQMPFGFRTRVGPWSETVQDRETVTMEDL